MAAITSTLILTTIKFFFETPTNFFRPLVKRSYFVRTPKITDPAHGFTGVARREHNKWGRAPILVGTGR